MCSFVESCLLRLILDSADSAMGVDKGGQEADILYFVFLVLYCFIFFVFIMYLIFIVLYFVFSHSADSAVGVDKGGQEADTVRGSSRKARKKKISLYCLTI